MNKVTTNAKGSSEVIETVIVNPDLYAKHHTLQAVMKFLKDNDERLGYLKDRWLDEREYEEFDDYEKAVTDIFVRGGYIVVSVSKGFVIRLQKYHGETGRMIEIEVRINAASVKARATIAA